MPEDIPRVLVDTNVWISAFINGAGTPAQVLDAFWEDRFAPVVSEPLLSEIQDVAYRPDVRRLCRFGDDILAAILARLRHRSIPAVPTGGLHLCRDPRDDFVLETAMLGRAQVVVSRDDDIKPDLDLIAHLQEHGIEVLSVAQFIEWLTARSS